jgi:hypothetical protein
MDLVSMESALVNLDGPAKYVIYNLVKTTVLVMDHVSMENVNVKRVGKMKTVKIDM